MSQTLGRECVCAARIFESFPISLPMNDIFALVEGMSLQGGKYTIVRMLSHGGFGVTYLAHHNLLDVDVCIKEFFPSLWCNRDAFSYEVSVSTTGNVDMVDRFMQKFIKEAQSIARLHHEGIVKIHDVFEENGTAYYVMDFIEGQTLKNAAGSNSFVLSVKKRTNAIGIRSKAGRYGGTYAHRDIAYHFGMWISPKVCRIWKTSMRFSSNRACRKLNGL